MPQGGDLSYGGRLGTGEEGAAATIDMFMSCCGPCRNGTQLLVGIWRH